MQFKIITFGCKLNQAESEKIAADLVAANFIQVNKNQIPDLIILNVCAVTHKAVREGRQKVAELKRKYPDTKIIVTGCIDEGDWEGVDVWVTNENKKSSVILNVVKNLAGNYYLQRPACRQGRDPSQAQDDKGCVGAGLAPAQAHVQTTVQSSRIRAFVKIQDGCDNFCAYCIVPLMRGQPRSLPVSEIIQDIQDKEKQGYKEIVLTGVNIGLYGNSQYPITNNPAYRTGRQKISNNQILNNKINKKLKIKNKKFLNLVELLKIILTETSIPRIRLSSLWPTDLTPELIDLIAKNPRICPHVHLSIQSGSNHILKAMGRDYSREKIIQITEQAKKKISKINFTGDLIVGFPGETEQDFADSLDLVKQVGFSKVHVFKFSKRPGTRAFDLPGQIPDKIKQAHSRQLINLSDQVAKQVKSNLIGQEFNVLWEEKRDGNYYGWTENYIKIKAREGKLNGIDKIKVRHFES